MPTPERNWDKAIETLSPARAERWSAHDNKLWSEGDLVAYWPAANESVMEEAVSYLRLYCDVSNGTKKRTWCDDPKIGETPYPGRWRLFRVYYDRGRSGQPGVVRELKRGFATEINWAEALQVGGDVLQTNAASPDGDQTEAYIEVVFPSVDPESVHAMVTALQTAQKSVDPVIQGQTRTGTYEYIHVRPDKQEDGSFWIRLLMAKPQYSFSTKEKVGTPDETNVTYYWNVPKRLAQALATAQTTGTNAAALANYATQQGVVDITVRKRGTVTALTILDKKTEDGALLNEFTDWYWGMDKTAADALTTGDPAPAGWIYSIAHISYDGQGNYSARRVRTQAIAITLYTDKVIHIGAQSTVKRSRYLNQTSLPDAIGYAQGKIKKLVEADKNRFGVWDYTVDTEEIAELSNYRDVPTDTDGVISEKMPSMTALGWHIVGATSRPGYPTTGYGRVNVVRRDDGLWYGEKVDVTPLYSVAVYSDNWTAGEDTGVTRELVDFFEENGVRKRRTITFTMNIKRTNSRTTAEAYINGGKWGSKIITHSNARGPYGYEAINVTKVVFGGAVPDVAGAL
jgi:hypothetical protein